MLPVICQDPACPQPTDSQTAFCADHQTGFRWHRGRYVIHCDAPRVYRAVHQWTKRQKVFGSFVQAETFALRPKSSRPRPTAQS